MTHDRYVRVYARLASMLLPSWFHARVGHELVATFADRVGDARSAGDRRREVVRELVGLARIAAVSRLSARRKPTDSVTSAERGWAPIDVFRQDLRFGVRAMRRSRGVAGLVVLTLALGVGASSAMFSIIETVLLRPLPFDRPEQIVFVHPTLEEWRTNPSLSSEWQLGRFSPPELRTWLERQQSFDAAGGYSVWRARVPRGTGSERIQVGRATAGFWRALRVTPALGRLPIAADATEPVAVLTHDFWVSNFGSDAAVVGKTFRLNDSPVRVVGVLPSTFALVDASADLWQPYEPPSNDKELNNHMLLAVGRLRDGVSLARAEQELASILRGVAAVDPKHITHGAHLVAPVAQATAKIRVPLLILAAASLILLVAACANVALLLLGTGADRLRELAVRQALGAKKSRIVVQLLTESVVLGGGGAIAGMVVAAAVTRVLVAIMPAGIPRLGDVRVDLRTFLLASLLAIVTSIVAGCFPAVSLSRVSAGESLRTGATTQGRGRLQHAIVVAELALATVLLVGAGLLTRTLAVLQRVQPGFDPTGVVAVQLNLPWDRFYPPNGNADSSRARAAAFISKIADEVRSIPGVSNVAFASDMPYSGDRGTNAVQPEGYRPPKGEVVDAARRFVTSAYFDLLRIRPLQGRVLGPDDTRPGAERVMVVTDAFARHFWPDGRWLDRTVGLWDESYRVVGIIADTHEHDLRGDEDRFKFYVPARVGDEAADNILVRTRMDPALLAPVLRDRIWRVDASIVIEDVMPLTERMARSLTDDRYRMRLMVAFSIAAGCFALFGVYGVISRTVVRRRRELGLRVALGAPRSSILSLVLGDAARIALVGVAIGAIAALFASRVLASIVWGVPPSDPVSFAAAGIALLTVTVIAATIPARRATRVEAMIVMRS
jgi:putative ABC transport system permease protein